MSNEAWHNRGSSLNDLGRYEEAIASYDQAIQIKLDYHYAWNNRGIVAYKGSSQGQPTVMTAVHPELFARGYTGRIISLKLGLTYCPADTHPLGHGFLQRALGDAHWDYAYSQSNRRYYWHKALAAYELSLRCLNEIEHPEERLQTLQRLLRVHAVLLELSAETIQVLLRQGTELRTHILDQAHSAAQRDHLNRSLPNFNELTVDFLLRQSNVVKALETAEADKNGLMQWLLREPGTATYEQMRHLLQTYNSPGKQTTAVLYWHLSANAITTFILHPGNPAPMVLRPSDPGAALEQRHNLETWITDWNKAYTKYLELAKTEETTAVQAPWRTDLAANLDRLAKILNIPALQAQLPHITQLILIPHRDLHRFPLHSFFPHQTCTYLPSLHIGCQLRPGALQAGQIQTGQIQTEHTAPHPASLLNLPAPRHHGTAPLPAASIEAIALERLLHQVAVPVTTHPDITQAQLQTCLQAGHTLLHFNGHAYHNAHNPKQSALALQGDDELTVANLTQLNLQTYHLVCLPSCETALTGAQSITSEYVGLASVLLGHRIPHVLSSLWTVDSTASALFVLQFYRQWLLKGLAPSQALVYSQTWLANVTYQQLTRFYRYCIRQLPPNDEIRTFLKTEQAIAAKMKPTAKPYSDPYYWAAFILAGRG